MASTAQGGLKIPAGSSGGTFKRLDLTGTWTGPVVSGGAGYECNDITFERIRVSTDPKFFGVIQPKWGWRTYNFRNAVFEDCLTENIWSEHAWYINVIGGIIFRRCKAQNIGAQGLQIVWRSGEGKIGTLPGGLESWQDVGTHLVERCEFRDVGKVRGDGRRSYALSFFGKQNQPTLTTLGPRSFWPCPVVVKDTIVENSNATAGGELRGALLCEWRPSLHVFGGSISHDGTADRPLVYSYMTDEVVLDGANFHGQKQIDIIGAKKIEITGCTGTVMVRVNGTNVGPVNQDFSFAA